MKSVPNGTGSGLLSGIMLPLGLDQAENRLRLTAETYWNRKNDFVGLLFIRQESRDQLCDVTEVEIRDELPDLWHTCYR